MKHRTPSATMNFVSRILIVLTAGASFVSSADTHGYYEVYEGRLYYADLHLKLTRDQAVQFCTSLGGQVPEFESKDRSFVSNIGSTFESTNYLWLDGVSTSASFQSTKFTRSGREVPHDLWSPLEPICSGSCSDDSIAINTNPGGLLGLWDASGGRHPFCVFDLKDSNQMRNLDANSNLVYSADQQPLRDIIHSHGFQPNSTTQTPVLRTFLGPSDVHGFYVVRNDVLFYANLFMRVPKREAVNYCGSLGAQVPEFHVNDKPFVFELGSSYNSTTPLWLDGEYANGGFRYTRSGQEIPHTLWENSVPSCGSLSSCAVAIYSSPSRALNAWPETSLHHPFCFFDLKNEAQVKKLAERMHLRNESDRLPVYHLITNYRMEQQTKLIAKLRSALDQFESKARAAHDWTISHVDDGRSVQATRNELRQMRELIRELERRNTQLPSNDTNGSSGAGRTFASSLTFTGVLLLVVLLL